MFVGTAYPRLDEKGRLALPARYRDELSGGVVITPGQERCLYVFTPAEFATKASEMASKPTGDKQRRTIQRVLAASAHDVVPDKQGRVGLTPQLRTYAGLDRETAVIGVLNRLEIWDVAAWQRFQSEHESEFANLDEGVLPDFF